MSMSFTSNSSETRILGCLLRMAPYATTAFTAFNVAVLRSLLRRGLIHMDPWGVVSLTRQGELAAIALL